MKTLRQVAVEAGLILLEGWGTNPAIRSKTVANDLVTEFDKRSEAYIVDALSRAFPSSSVIAEEGHCIERPGASLVLYVDPLDGTTNFAHGLPIFSVSIGLALEGVPIAGVVHAPALSWTFSGAQGHGAQRDGKPIKVSSVRTVSEALVGTGFSVRRPSPDVNIPEFTRLTAAAHATRRLGSAAIDLCCVACGWMDGFWEHLLKPWDSAAGSAIIVAAGGCVTDLDGAPLRLESGRILATNGQIHDELSRMLA